VFSGIVEDLGTVREIASREDGALLTVAANALPVARVKIGDSIAVNGCCLTVIGKHGRALSMELSAETLRRTVLGRLEPGERVNLERALKLDSMLNGHLVSGHVDGIACIVAVEQEGDSHLMTFEVPVELSRYLVEKGSAAVDGISLTVFAINGARFSCAVIPHTMKATTLGLKSVGCTVNFEADLLGKYVEKLLAGRLSETANHEASVLAR
jgi:riboflavin synthase